MGNRQNFLEELSFIQRKYSEEKERAKQFNIFTALHDAHNEKYLHSRFIAYLLSPKSNHGAGKAFLTMFLNVIKKRYSEISQFEIVNCEVQPNEEKKSEYKDIDILIKNGRQAIIIENKIFARDSNYDKKEENSNDIQLVRYHNRLIEEGYQDKNIFVFYLTLDRHKPERSEEIKFPVFLIEYRKEIKDWLDECIRNTNNYHFIEILYQYQMVIDQLTNDVERAKKLKSLIAKYMQSDFDMVWSEKERIFGMGDFKHLKWHTVDDFWNGLKEKLKLPVIKDINVEDITEITHKDRGNKKPFGITVDIGNSEELYIMNDGYKGLTYGNPKSTTKEQNVNWFSIDENIKFSDFKNKETFELINDDKRKDLINEIEKIVEKTKNLPILCRNLA